METIWRPYEEYKHAQTKLNSTTRTLLKIPAPIPIHIHSLIRRMVIDFGFLVDLAARVT